MRLHDLSVPACIRGFAAAVAAFSIITGCTSVVVTGDGAMIDKAQVLEMKPGVTDKKAVIAAFGEPNEASSVNNEEVLTYTYKEKKTPVYLLGLVENEAGGVKTSATLEIILKDGIVSSYKYKAAQE